MSVYLTHFRAPAFRAKFVKVLHANVRLAGEGESILKAVTQLKQIRRQKKQNGTINEVKR